MTETTEPETAVEEEYFNDKPTGVEVEQLVPPALSEPEPWDPEKIRIHTKHYSLKQMVDMMAEGDVDLAPDFQRQYVWKNWQQWSLIESLLLGIPLPSFYLNEDPDGRMQVVDGVQRLTTIYNFVHKKSFHLGKITYLRQLQDLGFDQLDGMFKRRIHNSQLVAHVIDPQTPYKVKFDIFRRINTGGTPLSAQEIRHCMSGDRSREFLRSLANDPAFLRATGESVKNHPRMADREIALRFLAFRIHTVSDYAKSSGLDEFLGKATEAIDKTLKEAELDQLRAAFRSGMKNAYTAFGDHAFRKWPLGSDRRNPINRALVETWANVLADHDVARIEKHKKRLVERARKLMTDDGTYIAAIIGNTGDTAAVRERFDKARKLAQEILK